MQRQVIVTRTVRSFGRAGHSKADFDRRRIVGRVQVNPVGLQCQPKRRQSCCEIHHCRHWRLVQNRFQVASEEEIQGIEVQETWRPSNRFAVSYPPSGICGMEWPVFSAATLGNLQTLEERWEAPNHFPDVIPQNWDETKPSRTVTCMMLKTTANERRTFSSLSR
ncbi:hypothetical protein TNCV_1902271 [Trichonephila clavipes]|nr:hypothetical protein TNCV_1902271 [Trichonephila clavipes]